MALIVRRAIEEDARTIAQFALRLFAQHRAYDPARFADLSDVEGAAWFYGSRIAAENAALLVAEHEGKVVGFVYLEYEAINYADLLENAVWLHDLYIDESARGIGAGKELLESATKFARQMGAGKLVLTVAAENALARAFFEHLGFRPTMIEMTLNLDD